jgi:hypothetical protein
MKKTLVRISLVAIALVLLGAPKLAHADYQGYVCHTSYNPFPNYTGAPVGNYGSLWFDLYSQPKCTGAYLASFSYFTTGSTRSTIVYSELGINTLFQALVSAMKSGMQILVQGNDTTNAPPPIFSAG